MTDRTTEQGAALEAAAYWKGQFEWAREEMRKVLSAQQTAEGELSELRNEIPVKGGETFATALRRVVKTYFAMQSVVEAARAVSAAYAEPANHMVFPSALDTCAVALSDAIRALDAASEGEKTLSCPCGNPVKGGCGFPGCSLRTAPPKIEGGRIAPAGSYVETLQAECRDLRSQLAAAVETKEAAIRTLHTLQCAKFDVEKKLAAAEAKNAEQVAELHRAYDVLHHHADESRRLESELSALRAREADVARRLAPLSADARRWVSGDFDGTAYQLRCIVDATRLLCNAVDAFVQSPPAMAGGRALPGEPSNAGVAGGDLPLATDEPPTPNDSTPKPASHAVAASCGAHPLAGQGGDRPASFTDEPAAGKSETGQLCRWCLRPIEAHQGSGANPRYCHALGVLTFAPAELPQSDRAGCTCSPLCKKCSKRKEAGVHNTASESDRYFDVAIHAFEPNHNAHCPVHGVKQSSERCTCDPVAINAPDKTSGDYDKNCPVAGHGAKRQLCRHCRLPKEAHFYGSRGEGHDFEGEEEVDDYKTGALWIFEVLDVNNFNDALGEIRRMRTKLEKAANAEHAKVEPPAAWNPPAHRWSTGSRTCDGCGRDYDWAEQPCAPIPANDPARKRKETS